MSVEHMLPDTSIARTIMVWLRGHATGRRRAARGPPRAPRSRWRAARSARGGASAGPAARRPGSARGWSSARRPGAPAAGPRVQGEERGTARSATSRLAHRKVTAAAPRASESAAAREQEREPERATRRRQLHGLVAHHQRAGELVVDAGVACVGRQVGARGPVGERLERRLVQPGLDAEAVEVEGRARRRPDARASRCGSRGPRRPWRRPAGRGARCSRRRCRTTISVAASLPGGTGAGVAVGSGERLL